MELSDTTTQVRIENHEPSPEQAVPEGSASFLVRLWAYGGPGQPLSSLAIDSDPEVAELIRSLITEGQGRIMEQGDETLLACFHSPLHALAAAKALQHRLLTFHRLQPPQQVVASIVISGWKGQAASRQDSGEPSLIDGSYTAQILVSEHIYEIAHNKPGFQFSPKPVREAGDGASSESIYELLWTDESTYGHLREAGQSTGIHTAGRYHIQGELGRGAMGIVYKAYDQLIGRTVALKTISIDRNAPNRRELIERLKREAKAAGGLDHPNIITIYDVGQEDDRVYLSMQFLEGKTLLAMLAEGRLPPLPTLISYAEQICSAVGFAHARGVIHRDLKPANLMLTSQGIIKVLDFGIAKIEDATLTQTGLVVGTPTHMAPEQAADRKVDQRTDIFALGSVFYELFTLEKPFKGDVTTVLYKIMHEDPLPPSIINPALPGGIDAIIRKALSKDPKDRFQSCEEMGKAFAEQAALLKSSPAKNTAGMTVTVAAPVKRPSPPSPSYLLETTTVPPRRRIWPWLVTVLTVAMMGAAGWAYYVKLYTGSFPRVPEKVVAVWHRLLPPRVNGATPHQPSENEAGRTGSADPANLNAPNSHASDGAPLNGANPAPPSAGGSTTTAAQPSTTTTQATNGQSAVDNPAGAPTNGPGPSETSAATSAPQPGGAQSPNTQGNEPNQTGAGNTHTADTPAPADSTKASSVADNQDDRSPEEVRRKPPKPSVTFGPTVEGFSRRDVPELLRQADAAAARGDYRMALYEYNLILKIDRNNAAARAGLRRVQAAQLDGTR
jgi:serine/threonine-protein kinase